MPNFIFIIMCFLKAGSLSFISFHLLNIIICLGHWRNTQLWKWIKWEICHDFWMLEKDNLNKEGKIEDLTQYLNKRLFSRQDIFSIYKIWDMKNKSFWTALLIYPYKIFRYLEHVCVPVWGLQSWATLLVVNNPFNVITWICCCSISQSYPTLWDSMNCSTPGFPVHH